MARVYLDYHNEQETALAPGILWLGGGLRGPDCKLSLSCSTQYCEAPVQCTGMIIKAGCGNSPAGSALTIMFGHLRGATCLLSLPCKSWARCYWRMLILLVCLAEMTLLSSQTPSLETSSSVTESPEHRMLEKRSKVIEELLQTERDYIRDLEMCVERIMVPLQQAQVGVWGEATR